MKDYAAEIHWQNTGLDRRRINGRLKPARNSTMRALVPMPRGSFGPTALPPTNPIFKNLLVTHDFGLFKVTGLAPAIETLKQILRDIRKAQPDLYERLGSTGMLSCRLVRGSEASISNHAWGTAIDLTIDGTAETWQGNGVQKGLLDLYHHFNNHGFYWGAAFPKEDTMHFEASEQLIRRWSAAGKLTLPWSKGIPRVPSFGDRGCQVEALQLALSKNLPYAIEIDGFFGRDTLAAITSFQAQRGFRTDGVIGAQTRDALDLA